MHTKLIEVVCEPSCVNGTCILDGVCQCFSGWTGPICNQGSNDLSLYRENIKLIIINHTLTI